MAPSAANRQQDVYMHPEKIKLQQHITPLFILSSLFLFRPLTDSCWMSPAFLCKWHQLRKKKKKDFMINAFFCWDLNEKTETSKHAGAVRRGGGSPGSVQRLTKISGTLKRFTDKRDDTHTNTRGKNDKLWHCRMLKARLVHVWAHRLLGDIQAWLSWLESLPRCSHITTCEAATCILYIWTLSNSDGQCPYDLKLRGQTKQTSCQLYLQSRANKCNPHV